MAKEGYVLTEHAARELAEMHAWWKNQRRNPYGRPAVPHELGGSPEVCQALVPAAGIPALVVSAGLGTGTGSDRPDTFIPGATECEFFQIRWHGFQEVLHPLGFSHLVYNVSRADIEGPQFIPVQRAKDGHWLSAIRPATGPEEPPTGTGTGTGGGDTNVTTTNITNITLTYEDNSIVLTLTYNTTTLTINNGVITNITNVTNLTTTTTIDSDTLNAIVCNQECEKWWCINPFGTGTATGTASGTGTGDRYCFFGTRADLAAELAAFGGTATGPFDSEQACQDECLAGRAWWCITPAAFTGTGTGSPIVHNACTDIGGHYPILHGLNGLFADAFRLTYYSDTNRWENTYNQSTGVGRGEGAWSSCMSGGAGKTGLEMWCDPADGKMHLDYFCAGTLVASVAGDYTTAPGNINFGYYPSPDLPDQSTLTCAGCDFRYIVITEPLGPGAPTGTGTAEVPFPAAPFCFYGTEAEAGDAAAAAGGTFTGPFMHEATCLAVCAGGTGTGTGTGTGGTIATDCCFDVDTQSPIPIPETLYAHLFARDVIPGQFDCTCLDGVSFPIVYDANDGLWRGSTVPPCSGSSVTLFVELECVCSGQCVFIGRVYSSPECMNQESGPVSLIACEPFEWRTNSFTDNDECFCINTGSDNSLFDLLIDTNP